MKPPRRLSLQDIHEDHEDGCIQEIDDESADERNDEVSGMRRAESFAHGVHIRDGVRCGTKAEAAAAGCHDGCFVISSHDAEDDEVSEEAHDGNLHDERCNQRNSKVCQLPEFQAHERTGKEYVQADAAKDFTFPLVASEKPGHVGNIPDDGSNEHGTDVSREYETDIDEELADICAKSHGKEELSESVHEAVHIEVSGCIITFDFMFRAVFRDFISVFIFIGFQMEATDQKLSDRAAKETPRDKAEGSGSKSNRCRILKTQCFKDRTEGAGCAVTADKRYRTICKTHERIQREGIGKSDTDQILNDNQEEDKKGHLDDKESALLDETDACHVADTGEEEHHAPVLHDGILRIVPDALRVKDAVHDRENRPADDRRRNAVFPENADPVLQEASQEEDGDSGCQRLVQIKFYCHSIPSFYDKLYLLCIFCKHSLNKNDLQASVPDGGSGAKAPRV